MSMELIAIGGIGVTIISVGIALAGLILHGQNGLRDLRAEMREGFKAQGEAIKQVTGRCE